MNLQPISLEHKRILGGLKNRTNTMFADYSFAYLYLHRHIYFYNISHEPFPFVTGKTSDGLEHLMPLEPVTPGNVHALVKAARLCGAVFPIHERDIPLFGGMGLCAATERGDSDYIYSIEKLKYYHGKKLHGQRNLLSQFNHKYTCEIYPLTGERRPRAMEVLDAWQDQNSAPRAQTDYISCAEGIMLADELDLTGYIFSIADKPAGFILGEIINGDTFTVLFAKGLRGIKGIYQFMNNSAALAMPESVKFFNFVQDMNIEGLRKAKLSYNPDFILNKYRVIL